MGESESIAGFYAPVHRALIEPILLGGAPRAVAILNGQWYDSNVTSPGSFDGSLPFNSAFVLFDEPYRRHR